MGDTPWGWEAHASCHTCHTAAPRYTKKPHTDTRRYSDCAAPHPEQSPHTDTPRNRTPVLSCDTCTVWNTQAQWHEFTGTHGSVACLVSNVHRPLRWRRQREAPHCSAPSYENQDTRTRDETVTAQHRTLSNHRTQTRRATSRWYSQVTRATREVIRSFLPSFRSFIHWFIHSSGLPLGRFSITDVVFPCGRDHEAMTHFTTTPCTLFPDFVHPVDQTVLLSVDRAVVQHCARDREDRECVAEEEKEGSQTITTARDQKKMRAEPFQVLEPRRRKCMRVSSARGAVWCVHLPSLTGESLLLVREILENI